MSIHPILESLNPWWRDPAARAAGRFPRRRDLQAPVCRRIGDFSDRRAVVLLGPRQAGKTVLVKQVADDLLDAGLPGGNLSYFDFSDYRLTEEVSPDAVLASPPPTCDPGKPRVLLLDEVGSAASWDRWLKAAVDREPEVKVLATDSSAALLRGGSRESGPGRWDELRLEGLTFPEYLRLATRDGEASREALRREPRHLPRYLACGGFPEHLDAEETDPVRARLRADVAERAILRDLLRERVDVRNVLRLFVCLVGDSGAILNLNSRANDLQVDQRTLGEYVRLLTDTMLVVPLEKRAIRGPARLRGRPRLYAADHGLVAAFSVAADPSGRIAEAVAFRHLRELADPRAGEITYFRKDDQLEADFVLEGAATPLPIEVTCSAAPDGLKLTALRKVMKKLKVGRGVVVFGGLTRERRGEIDLVPLADFLLDPRVVLDE